MVPAAVAASAERQPRAWFGRTVALLLIMLPPAAHSHQAAFDTALATRVFSAAFTFMAPRTLVAVALPQLCAWGLHGITALDPALSADLEHGAILLTRNGRKISQFSLPADDDFSGWAELVAAVNQAAFARSAALRRAGSQGAVESFFDEVFNHLDPYSRYEPPREAITERDWREGASGIGVALSAQNGRLFISGIVPQSPADLAGLAPGEELVAIDNWSLHNADLDQVLNALAGPPGSTVRATLHLRDRVRTLTLTRADVPADTVASGIDQGVLVLRITGFTASTAPLIQAALSSAMAARPELSGFVMDLRGNRGGLLREAVAAANLLLSRGVIATTLGRAPQAQHQWIAHGPDLALGLPIVVLVDGRTASAAEILAAALSDDGRAVVVGSSTFGKGLVQAIAPMPDGGELFITWSRVIAPDGWPLQGLGVMPEACTSLGEDDTRRQLDALAHGHSLGSQRIALHRSARVNTPLAEILAIRNTCPADLGHAGDLDVAKFLINNPLAYAAALAPL
ncbi:MAG: S41 family peptidase [Acidocella sp.]|nr:S41 family peptidase [Acidocella sp.]